MEPDWYSVEQVADRLGLHVRTVRGYIRDGRLAAVRIGKQYRVARADLDALTGRPAAPARSRAEVSAVVEIDGIGAAAADRLSTFLVAGAQLSGGAADPLRVRAVHDDAQARLKVIILGGVAATAGILQTVHEILTSENGMFLSDPGGGTLPTTPLRDALLPVASDPPPRDAAATPPREPGDARPGDPGDARLGNPGDSRLGDPGDARLGRPGDAR